MRSELQASTAAALQLAAALPWSPTSSAQCFIAKPEMSGSPPLDLASLIACCLFHLLLLLRLRVPNPALQIAPRLLPGSIFLEGGFRKPWSPIAKGSWGDGDNS